MTCPICAKESVPAYRPFCSRRCADVDLGKWLNEGYAIPDEGSDAAIPPADPEDGDGPRH